MRTSKQVLIFANRQEIWAEKYLFSDDLTCTGPSSLSPVRPLGGYTNIWQNFKNRGVKPAPPHVILRMVGREQKIGAFLPISDMRVQKRPLKFFETKNIFIFEAGPNFGRGQKRRFTLFWRFFQGPNWGPKTPN